MEFLELCGAVDKLQRSTKGEASCCWFWLRKDSHPFPVSRPITPNPDMGFLSEDSVVSLSSLSRLLVHCNQTLLSELPMNANIWDVTPWNLVQVYWHFAGSTESIFKTEEWAERAEFFAS
jgi:hypothetical protein